MKPLSLLIYQVALWMYKATIWITSFSNIKAKLWLQGRKNLINNISTQVKKGEKYIWFHCASLGEFEQGRTLIEKIRNKHPESKIVLTFFSPSGYQVRKNYQFADYVFYLPMDSPGNAKKLIETVNPYLAVFVKYEFWYYYFTELKKRSIPLVLVSSVFRKDQQFFKWYGGLYRKMLACVSHFFVLDERSEQLLNGLGYENVTHIHDTRIDRVIALSQNPKSDNVIDEFINDDQAFIGGSIYEKENMLIYEAFSAGIIKNKIILVPHNIENDNIDKIRKLWGDYAAVYSEIIQGKKTEFKVLIVDSIGLLGSIYSKGKIAFIGGGFGSSIHNILEPAVYGLPIIFGPNFSKFKEANDLLALGGAFSVEEKSDFFKTLKYLSSPNNSERAGQINRAYIQSHAGGSEIVYHWLSNSNLI